MSDRISEIQPSSPSSSSRAGENRKISKAAAAAEKSCCCSDCSRLSKEASTSSKLSESRRSGESSGRDFKNAWNPLPRANNEEQREEPAYDSRPRPDLQLPEEQKVKGELQAVQNPEEGKGFRAAQAATDGTPREGNVEKASGGSGEDPGAPPSVNGQDGGNAPAGAQNTQQQMMNMMMQMMQTMTQMMNMMMQMMQKLVNGGGLNNNTNNNTNNTNNNTNNTNNNNNNNSTFRYGNNVSWLNFQQQKNSGNNGGGKFLDDIESHLPSRYGTQYRDRDKVTWSHETTHGINAHISNQHYDGGKRKTGLYVGDNKGVVLDNPNMRKSDINGQVPDSLRGSRFNLYLNGQRAFENEPHYILDEWVAYTNGLQTGVDLGKNGQGRDGNIVGLGAMGALEFTAYAFAEAKAISEKDPNYWNSEKGKQFKEFIAWHGLRSMDLVREGSQLERSKESGQERYLENFKKGSDAKQLRDFISREFGEDYLRRLLG